MHLSEEYNDGDMLTDANSVKYKVELVLIKVRFQVGFSLIALMVSFYIFLLLLKALMFSNSPVGTYELYFPGVMLLMGFIFIQSIRCFRMSIFLYSSAVLSRKRIDASIDDWNALRGAESGYE